MGVWLTQWVPMLPPFFSRHILGWMVLRCFEPFSYSLDVIRIFRFPPWNWDELRYQHPIAIQQWEVLQCSTCIYMCNHQNCSGELPAFFSPRISLVKSQLLGRLVAWRLDQIGSAWSSRNHLAVVKWYRWLSLNLGDSGGWTSAWWARYRCVVTFKTHDKQESEQMLATCMANLSRYSRQKKTFKKKKNVYYSSIYESPPSEWNIKAWNDIFRLHQNCRKESYLFI